MTGFVGEQVSSDLSFSLGASRSNYYSLFPLIVAYLSMYNSNAMLAMQCMVVGGIFPSIMPIRLHLDHH